MNKIGEVLKTTRERRSLTLSQAAQRINVREEYLEKIENDEVLNNDVFTIGYIRLYSKYLRVNVDTLIKELKEEISEVVEDSVEAIAGEDERKSSGGYSKKKIFAVAAITIILLISTFSYLGKDRVKEDLENKSVPKKSIDLTEEKTSVNVLEEKYLVNRIDDSRFEIKNISNPRNIKVLALDSTVVTFIDESGKSVKELFVKLGDNADLPEGYKNLTVKTRIPSSIKIQEVNEAKSAS